MTRRYILMSLSSYLKRVLFVFGGSWFLFLIEEGLSWMLALVVLQSVGLLVDRFKLNPSPSQTI